ncbi:DNA-deoxyinosine glycosylase / YjeF family N-terminal domain multi-domain protein [Slackia sp. CM382]|uniref:DNA-deoxyinosine glycosylase n=1 Tax=Slackia sp. CM382 TaxID=1111137 RepID=UPI00027C6B35|nr:DNA-deoxyinosine glycosylase [Slackia sp. CM382]EJU34800.1 DNA-deoxyinosine glycosylase / YjeF family N-terminal domain multi-domain protein [Slackia sp. CM382]
MPAAQDVTHPFEPVFDERSQVLVLGTMPSPRSREEGFYYAHPRNRFWRVIAQLFDEPLARTNEERIDQLLRHHIALWDVLASCRIEGAKDASIRDAVPNDLARIMDAAPVTAVFCTGTAAAQAYRRFSEPKTGIACMQLPSTSPANAAMGLDVLVDAYQPLAAAAAASEAPLLDVPDVVRLEQAIAEAGTPLSTLMDRAGTWIAHRAIARIEALRGDTGKPTETNKTSETNDRSCPHPSDEPRAGHDGARRRACDASQVVVLCGNGNNGGDGWVAARILADAGLPVSVICAKEPHDLRAQPARNAAIEALTALEEHGARVLVSPDPAALESKLQSAAVIIDAILGTGFSGGSVAAPFDAWIEAAVRARNAGAFIIAADVPSGLSAQTGRAVRPCIKADETVTMLAMKPGLSTPFAFAWAGTVRIGAIAYVEPLLERMACEDNAPATGKDGKPDPAGSRGKKTPGKLLHAKAGDEDRAGAADDQADRAKESRRRDIGAEEPRRSRTRTEQTANPSAVCSALRQDPFARAEQEDDDGYDPYSDRPPMPEPVFQRDPWA